MNHFFVPPNDFVVYNDSISISASMVSNADLDLKPTMDSNNDTPYNSDVSLKISSLLNGGMDPNIITSLKSIEDGNYAYI